MKYSTLPSSLIAIMAVTSCSSIEDPDQIKFDKAEYIKNCRPNLAGELFTKGNTASTDNMPQQLKGIFPIALPSPMIHAIIHNYGNTTANFKESYLNDSLFAINHSGYYEHESSTLPNMPDSTISILPGKTYTHTMSYPPIHRKGTFHVRMSGIYTEPLLIKYR